MCLGDRPFALCAPPAWSPHFLCNVEVAVASLIIESFRTDEVLMIGPRHLCYVMLDIPVGSISTPASGIIVKLLSN
jgi:hypothetical protein